jgi:nuclease-like protein
MRPSLKSRSRTAEFQNTMTIVDSARAAYRQRRLAGDDRAGVWARTRARKVQQAYVREHWQWMLVLILLGMAVFSAAAALAPDGFERGFLVGGGLAGIGGFLAVWVVQVTGTAPTMMGDVAEQWTAGELRKLRRSGWRTVNHFCLGLGDIDHVVVGPGGIFAIETKWSASPWDQEFGAARIADACRQVESNARQLTLWTDLKAAVAPIDVKPVVVLWGPGAPHVDPAISQRGRTTVVAGSAMEGWRSSLTSGVLTTSQLDAAWKVLDRQARRRDEHENPRNPTPASLYQMVLVLTAIVTSGVLGCLAALQLVGLSGSLAVDAATCLVLALAALPARRWKLGRYLSLAWQSGVAFAVLAMGSYSLIY